jgi:hypothetical protein
MEYKCPYPDCEHTESGEGYTLASAALIRLNKHIKAMHDQHWDTYGFGLIPHGVELECHLCDTKMKLVIESHDLQSEKHGKGDVWFCPKCNRLVFFNESGELIERHGKSWMCVTMDKMMKDIARAKQ